MLLAFIAHFYVSAMPYYMRQNGKVYWPVFQLAMDYFQSNENISLFRDIQRCKGVWKSSVLEQGAHVFPAIHEVMRLHLHY